MRIQHRIDSGNLNGEEIRFILAETGESLKGAPSGKMITDSDEYSFVYLFEEEEGYHYIHFTQEVWPLMVEALQSEMDPVLSFKERLVSLIGFRDELTMLIYNIEGNDNYGETFSSAVEQAFSSILQHVE
ncbi:hypothetical protein [Sporosarcina limicola]|uniref:Uncharacterized protein n=1 Tax=Sporosarcina limicola TaxID=34101 RepID=A0A927MLK0_9BACL|nr:hypothetical protein [Sporosarcina limicola]